MAYNKKNLLQRIVKIQNITLEQAKRGVSQEWIYNNLILPDYGISKRTYYNYLGTSAKSDLKKLINEDEADPKAIRT